LSAVNTISENKYRLLVNVFRINNIIIIIIFISSLLLLSNSDAYQDSNEQLKVKAAFVLNLARFIEWPDKFEEKEKPEGKEKEETIICFYQYNFLKKAIDTIRYKKINNKPIKIKRIRALTIKDRCEIVLIPASTLSVFVKYNNFDDLQQKITITDLSNDEIRHKSDQNTEASLENKIIFRLIRKDSRLRFEVNKIASERLGINIGSELLKLGILISDQDSDEKKENP